MLAFPCLIWLSAWMTLDRSFAHTRASEALPPLSETLAPAKDVADPDSALAQSARLVDAEVSIAGLLDVVVDTLRRRGPIKVGELGKQLHDQGGARRAIGEVKARHGGLKRFLEVAGEAAGIIMCQNHQFNPDVRLKEHPAPPEPEASSPDVEPKTAAAHAPDEAVGVSE